LTLTAPRAVPDRSGITTIANAQFAGFARALRAGYTAGSWPEVTVMVAA